MADDTLFRRLREAAAVAWTAYVDHPFVRALADGTLPEPCFRRYLTQDYLFLIHFARAYGLATFKADTLEDVRSAAAGLAAIVDREMALHVTYCRRWGLGENAMAAAPEAEATLAYTRFVLERGLAGDLLDLWVALAPCIVGYAEIARGLVAAPTTVRDGNPYGDWIDAYADASYQAVAEAHIAALDRLMARRGGPGRLPSLITVFEQATRLEGAFWQMGLDAPADEGA
jgi:thiaminase/transcriptional activator TenA